LHRVLDAQRLEVIPSHRETRPGLAAGEVAEIRHRMGHTRTQASPAVQHARCLAHRGCHVFNHLKRVVRNHEIEAATRERKCATLRSYVRAVEIVVLRMTQQRMSGIDGHDAMPARRQVTSDPALTTADLESSTTRRRHNEIEEAVPVVPIGVVARGASPANPVLRLGFPLRVPCHELKLRGPGRRTEPAVSHAMMRPRPDAGPYPRP
jgi:hypothetical protein